MTGSGGTNSARAPRLGLRRRARQSRMSMCSAARYLPHAGQLQGRQRHRDRQYRQRARGRPDEAHRAPRRRPRDQARRRLPGIPIQHRPAQPRGRRPRFAPTRTGAIAGYVGLCVRRQELHGDARWKYSQAGRQGVRLGCEGLLAIARRTTRSRPSTPAHRSGFCGGDPGNRSRAVSAATAAICSIRSASTCTTRRASMSETGVMR